MKRFLLFAFLSLVSFSAWSQQDPMFTKYMFNGLAYNPAFAGSPGYMSARMIYRNQWWAFEGAPTTQSFTIHSPVRERVGVGLAVMNDKVGSTGTTSVFGSYAYHIDFGKGRLAIGLQAGVINWRADWDDLKFRDPRGLDQSFNENPTRWLPNFGAGVFYYAPKYYIGFSVPHMLESDLNKTVNENAIKWAKLYRHFFFTTGAAIPISGDMMIFKPSIMIKSVGLLSSFSTDPSDPNRVGAPAEFDIDLSVLFYEAVWFGMSFRSAFAAKQFGGTSSFDSADVWAAYYLHNGLRIGLSYDYTLTQLQDYAKGSFELMLGYDMTYDVKKVTTPRYF
ncbi:MAG: type IX secretion system membrane protein PorP/SprF [Bacteroidota bacterium]